MEGNRYSIVSDYQNVDWSKVFTILMAFAHRLLSKENLRNKDLVNLSADFAQEAITSYLEAKDKFDPSRNPDLIMYLKYNLLQRLISNHVKSADNQKITHKNYEDLSVITKLIEEIPIDENIDIKSVVLKIQEDINHDEVMSIIFEARYEENMKRAEICQFFAIDPPTFDNAMKRLRRIVEKYLN